MTRPTTIFQSDVIKKMRVLCSSLIVILYLSNVSALYFHIAETERKCFIEEIPDETMVIGEFHLSLKTLWNTTAGVGHVIIARRPVFS